MRLLQHPVRQWLAAITTAVIVNTATSQASPIEQASQTTHHLEVLEQDLRAFLARLTAARKHADEALENAQADAKDADDKTADVKDQAEAAKSRLETATLAASTLAQLSQQFELAKSELIKARRAASEIAKSERGRKLAELQRQKDAEAAAHKKRVKEQEQAFAAALTLRSLKDTQKAYKDIQEACSKPPLGDTLEGRRLKALALYLQADGHVREYRSASGLSRTAEEQRLKKAVDLLDDVVEALAGDGSYSGSWGSSLSAAALRRAIGIQGAFYERYMAFKKRYRSSDKRASRFQERATKSKKSALGLYEELGRRFPDATTADRRYVVDAARDDVQQMFTTQLPRVIR